MTIEKQEELIKTIKEGSARQLQKIKKNSLLELISDIWENEEKSMESIRHELEEAKFLKELNESLVETNKETEQTINEYKDLVDSLKKDYFDSLSEKSKFISTIENLVNHEKILKGIIYILIVLEVLTILTIIL